MEWNENMSLYISQSKIPVLTNLEQGGVVGAAVVFITMRVQQAGVPWRNKDGSVIQAVF